MIVTTNLAFGEWQSVFGDAKMTTETAHHLLPLAEGFDHTIASSMES